LRLETSHLHVNRCDDVHECVRSRDELNAGDDDTHISRFLEEEVEAVAAMVIQRAPPLFARSAAPRYHYAPMREGCDIVKDVLLPRRHSEGCAVSPSQTQLGTIRAEGARGELANEAR
jgi:hypothetical protein